MNRARNDHDLIVGGHEHGDARSHPVCRGFCPATGQRQDDLRKQYCSGYGEQERRTAKEGLQENRQAVEAARNSAASLAAWSSIEWRSIARRCPSSPMRRNSSGVLDKQRSIAVARSPT